MAQTSSLWSRGLFWACLMCAGLRLVFAKQPTGLINTEDGESSYAFYFYLDITNRVFNSSLLDPSSEYYKTTKSEVDDLMNQIFKCSTCSTRTHYMGAKDMSFRAGNLIIVRMTILFTFPQNKGFINKYIVQYIFNDDVNDNQDQTAIKVNKIYTLAVPVTMATTTTTTPTTTPITTTPTTETPTTETPTTTTPTTTTSTTETPTTTSTTETTTTTSTTETTTTTSTTETPTTTPTTTPSTATSTPTPATSSSTTSTHSSTTGGVSHSQRDGNKTDDAATNHSTSAIPVYKTTGWTTDTNHYISNSTYTPRTPQHQERSNSTGTTAYPLVPYWLEWVPGWAIALLVLASLILLLLIILIILLLLRWCCLDEPDEVPKSDMYPQPYHSPYLSHSSAKTPILKHMADEVPRTPEKQKGNRAGMYVVNP